MRCCHLLVDERKSLEPGSHRFMKAGTAWVSRNTSGATWRRGFAEADVVIEESFRAKANSIPHGTSRLCRQMGWKPPYPLGVDSGSVLRTGKSRRSARLPFPMFGSSATTWVGAFRQQLQPGKYTIIATLLAKKTARPVKLFLTREETYLVLATASL